ncbi:unnamed protein product [Brassica oleracea]
MNRCSRKVVTILLRNLSKTNTETQALIFLCFFKNYLLNCFFKNHRSVKLFAPPQRCTANAQPLQLHSLHRHYNSIHHRYCNSVNLTVAATLFTSTAATFCTAITAIPSITTAATHPPLLPLQFTPPLPSPPLSHPPSLPLWEI